MSRNGAFGRSSSVGSQRQTFRVSREYGYTILGYVAVRLRVLYGHDLHVYTHC
jgi:hypothetical protein